MKNKMLLLFVLLFSSLVFLPSAFGQVEVPEVRPDTVYLYEEQVIYDTLYIYDTLPQPALMSKEQLMETYMSERGIGKLFYHKGKMYIAGTDKLHRLGKADLKEIFSAVEYDEYCSAKRSGYWSIPLYVAGAGAVACAGFGLYQFAGSFVMMSKAGTQLSDNDALVPKIWLSAMGGIAITAGSLVVVAGCLAPAVILTIRSKARLRNLAEEFGAPSTSLRLDLGPTPAGVGLTLSF